MALRFHQPAFPLSRYVDRMWWQTHAGLPSSRQRIYPDGAMALAIHLNKPTATFFIDQQPISVRVPLLAGPYSRSFHIDPSQSTAVVGVLFRPGAARMFFPISPHELHNADIALCDIAAPEADRLLNELCAAQDAPALFAALERDLLRRLKGAPPIHPAVLYSVDQIAREGGVRSVRQMERDTGLSPTRFIHLFREHVGLTPKLFCRVRRFHNALGRIEKGLPVQWAQIAADCGYFDQAHLIRDFRIFAGITPAECSREMSDADRGLLATVEAS